MNTLQTTLEKAMARPYTPDKNVIPKIVDPMGRYWEQPNPDNFLIDDTHAIMSQNDFERLGNYSHTTPTGVYHGKCWKAQQQGKWFLCWFGHDPDPKFVSNNYREIIIA